MNDNPPNSNSPRAGRLLQSGIIFSLANFVTLLGQAAFQAIIGRQLDRGEFGLVNSTISFIGLLGLPLLIATTAVTHYIARFNFSGDDARLHGLLAGCRKFLFHLTLVGSITAVILVMPLSNFFHFPRASLMLVALGCVLAGLWGSFVTALCQGLAWFKRLAFIGLLAVALRISFGWLATRIWPLAELAVLASAVMLLANLTLFFWRKEFPRRTDRVISPWTGEFVQFLIVSGACLFGMYCFTASDLLVAQRYFSGLELGNYSAAGLLARALPLSVAPLLTVLFTHRSGQSHGNALREQLKLLGLYAAGLICGAVVIFGLRYFLVKLIFGRPAPESAEMIGRFVTTMVFVGLLQALGMWSLASRWIKLSLLYGGLGLAYWITLLCLGKSPNDLLRVMPATAGIACGILSFFWLITMRRHKSNLPS
jgi:O-antigen/teichoic acid export membrane protein